MDNLRPDALLGGFIGEPDACGDPCQPCLLKPLRRVAAISPGIMEQMACGFRLARLPRPTAH